VQMTTGKRQRPGRHRLALLAAALVVALAPLPNAEAQPGKKVGAPAPRWLLEGVPFLEKELRRDASKEINGSRSPIFFPE
jgi:hypothetical protein